MQVETIHIVLTEQKNIAGIIRDPGYVLLEGICPENVTRGDLDRIIQLGKVKVVTVESKKEKKAEGSE